MNLKHHSMKFFFLLTAIPFLFIQKSVAQGIQMNMIGQQRESVKIIMMKKDGERLVKDNGILLEFQLNNNLGFDDFLFGSDDGICYSFIFRTTDNDLSITIYDNICRTGTYLRTWQHMLVYICQDYFVSVLMKQDTNSFSYSKVDLYHD